MTQINTDRTVNVCRGIRRGKSINISEYFYNFFFIVLNKLELRKKFNIFIVSFICALRGVRIGESSCGKETKKKNVDVNEMRV